MKLLILVTYFITENLGDNMFYWDLKPYVWKENNTVKGSIFYASRVISQLCNQRLKNFHQVQGGYLGFMKALKRNSYVLTDKGNVSVTKTDMWIPFMEPGLIKDANKFTFFESKEMVVIVPRYKIEIIYKIVLGVMRSLNFIGMCLIVASIAGVIIWFIVSMLYLNT